MWIRMLPGLAISIILAAVFCLDDNKPRKRPPSLPVRVTREAANPHPQSERPVVKEASRIFQTTTAAHPNNPTAETIARPYSLPDAAALLAPAESQFQIPAAATLPEAPPAPAREEYSAMAPARSGIASGQSRSTAVQFPVERRTENFTPARRVRLSGKIASDSALASTSTNRSGANRTSFPAGTLPPMAVAPSYTDLPPKGIYAWARAETFSGEQRLRDEGRSRYKHDGIRYGVGMKYDWSIDTVIGLSADLLDSEVKSAQPYDTRKNDITGYRVKAHYDSLLLEKYLVSANAFFASYETKGSGRIGGVSPGGVVTHAWREDKHNADMFGFSGRFGVPLIWGNDLKILNEIGVDYRRLRSKAYTADIVGLSTTDVPSISSTSFAIPLTTTVKRDFMQCWGIITPRVLTGIAFELDQGATGVRSLHASSASRFDYDPVTGFHSSGVQFDDSQKMLFEIGVGLDIKTVGGWELSAEYKRHMAEKFSEDRFKLELGRCF